MLGFRMKVLCQVAKLKLSTTSHPLSRTLPCLYSRRFRHGLPPSGGQYDNDYILDHDGEKDATEVDDMVEVLTGLSSSNPRDREKFLRDWKSDRRKRKKVIIKKKHFKPAQETSLLTWTAKEQIRSLHLQDPHIWSIERLTNSFPVSKEGILKILHSTYRPRTEEELRHHDERVRKRWHAIKALAGKEGGPVQTEFRQILDEQKLPLMINAAGMKNLTSPKPKVFPTCAPKKSTGIFEAIVKDYAKQIKKKEFNSAESSEFKGDCRKSRENDEELLRGIVQSNLSDVKRDQTDKEYKARITAGKTSDRSNEMDIEKSRPTRREQRLGLQKDRMPCVVDTTNLETYQLQNTSKQGTNTDESQHRSEMQNFRAAVSPNWNRREGAYVDGKETTRTRRSR